MLAGKGQNLVKTVAMRFILVGLCCLLLVFLTTGYVVSSPANAQPKYPDSWYLNEIRRVIEEEKQYHLKQFQERSIAARFAYAKNFGIQATTLDDFKKELDNVLEKAWIYVMDESGNIYGRGGYLTTIDINSPAITTLQNPSLINGANTGAFVRQTTFEGYRGARVEFRLPTSTLNEIGGPGTPYIYNGLMHRLPGSSGFFDMEGGLQYSLVHNNYSAFIRVNGGVLRFEDDSRLGTGTFPPRFRANTSFIHNLRYEPENLKVKYYASGTNIHGQHQLLVFSHSRVFTATEMNQLRVRRVTALASDNYNGTQAIGRIDIQYNNSTFLTSGGSTVSFHTNRLDQWLVNNIIYGTVDWPAAKITKTPVTGDITNQRHIINTN